MDLAVWRDISLIWLILLALVFNLAFAVVFYYFVRGVRRLRQLTRFYLPQVEERTRRVADGTEVVSQKVAGPIIAVESTAAHATGIIQAIVRRKQP